MIYGKNQNLIQKCEPILSNKMECKVTLHSKLEFLAFVGWVIFFMQKKRNPTINTPSCRGNPLWLPFLQSFKKSFVKFKSIPKYLIIWIYSPKFFTIFNMAGSVNWSEEQRRSFSNWSSKL